MKRLLVSLVLGILLGLGAFSMNASAMALEEKLWQVSPFLATFRDGQDLGELYSLTWGDTQILTYRASPGDPVPAGTYSPGNLEELGQISGRLRAVLLGGYPKVSAGDLEEKANAWLFQQDMPLIEALQTGEALTATQVTLWKLLEPELFRDSTLYGGWKDLTVASWSGYRKQVRQQEMLSQISTAHTAQNIASVCAYLENLNPVDAKTQLLSDDTLAQADYQATQAENGTWCITVTVPLDVSTGEAEPFVLRACCDGQEQVAEVDGPEVCTFLFSNLSAPLAVTLTLEGVQQGGDVFLFSGTDTKLLGWAEGPVPVLGQLTLSPDRILRIRKSSSPEDGSLPLANIQFNLYLAATREQLQRGEVWLGKEPTAQELESCQKPENLVAILSTDETGEAAYNFTAGGNPDGVYLVVEQFCAGTTGPVDPFYITIPAEGNYVQEIALENGLETQPDVQLSVTTRGWTEGTFAIGEPQTWYIWSSIPAGLSAARTYALYDLLPLGMDYEEGSALVTLETRTGESLHLVPDIHYTLSLDAGELEIALTPAGMAYAAANRGQGDREPGLLVCFQASLNETASLGTPISHRARLSYINGAGIHYSKTSPWAQVQTGGFSLRKTDAFGNPLSGNTYRLARIAGEGETAVTLDLAGTQVPVVYVSFQENLTLQQETATNADGKAFFSGLAYGEYYLVETHGTGEAPVRITVDAESHREDHTIQLVSSRGILPDTGGIGAALLTATGLLATLSACFLLFANRKRNF